jgi:Amidohydrolase family
MRVLVVLLLVLTGHRAWANTTKASPERIIFTNVNVIDTRNATVLRNMIVVVANDRIENIAKLGLIVADSRTHLINASGMYLIPGLWDMNVHTVSKSTLWDERVLYPLFLANGVTGVRDLSRDLIPLEQRRQRIERGELPGPHIISADPSASQKKDGVDLEEEATKIRMLRFGIVPDSITVNEAFPANRRSIERLAGVLIACSSEETELRREGVQALETHDTAAYAAISMRASATYDPAKAWNIFVQLSNSNTWQVPSLVWSQSTTSDMDLDLNSGALLRYFPASVRQQRESSSVMMSAEEMPAARKLADREVLLADAMRRAGVQFMAGTNGPDPHVLPGFSLHAELEWLVKSGFTPMQALQSATFNPALFLVKLDKFGVVEMGHAADLVLLEANPLEDIRNTRRIAAVVMNGNYYSRQQLDRLLEEAAEIAANT